MNPSVPADRDGMDPSKLNILVVEDEDDLREMITDELSDAGYGTRQACDGVDGLKAIREETPDLVLCDITMPNMNGYELLEEVRRSLGGVSEIEFVFLSALADKGQVVQGLRLGADDYLTKPVDYDLLLAKVESRLREVVRFRGERERQLVKLYKAFAAKEESAEADDDGQMPEAAVTQAGDEAKPPPAQSPSPQVADSEQFKDGLTRIARDHAGQVVAGKLQVIGLEGLRRRLGKSWSRHAERVYLTAEQTIKNRLAPQDVFGRNSNGDFVVCFAQLSEREAAVKAQALTNEIWNKLLGESSEAESLTVTADVHSLEIAPAEIAPAEDLLSTVTSRLAGMAETVGCHAKATLAELEKSAKLKLLPVWTNSGKAAPLAIAAFDARSKASIDQITVAKGDTRETAADVDILTLGKVCEQIYGHIREEKILVVTPVSYQTIRSPKLAKKFIGICNGLLPVAKERLIFNITGIPRNLLDTDLSIARLSAYSKYRMVEFNGAETGNIRLADLADLRVSLVCLPYGMLAPLLRADRPRLARLIAHIHDKNLKLLVQNISPLARDEMGRHGIDFLSFRES